MSRVDDLLRECEQVRTDAFDAARGAMSRASGRIPHPDGVSDFVVEARLAVMENKLAEADSGSVSGLGTHSERVLICLRNYWEEVRDSILASTKEQKS